MSLAKIGQPCGDSEGYGKVRVDTVHEDEHRLGPSGTVQCSAGLVLNAPPTS